MRTLSAVQSCALGPLARGSTKGFPWPLEMRNEGSVQSDTVTVCRRYRERRY